jgi:hypothetical protein
MTVTTAAFVLSQPAQMVAKEISTRVNVRRRPQLQHQTTVVLLEAVVRVAARVAVPVVQNTGGSIMNLTMVDRATLKSADRMPVVGKFSLITHV